MGVGEGDGVVGAKVIVGWGDGVAVGTGVGVTVGTVVGVIVGTGVDVGLTPHPTALQAFILPLAQ